MEEIPDWEKRFDELLFDGGKGGILHLNLEESHECGCYLDVDAAKSFIRAELLRLAEEIEGMRSEHFDESWTKSAQHQNGYNCGLTDAAALLRK